MNKKIGLLALLASAPLYAGVMGEAIEPYPWWGTIGTGYSWTNQPDIINPNPLIWDFANEGYDSSIGNRGFYTFALGKQVHEYVDVSLSYLNHEQFNYQQFQTGAGDTIAFTGGARTRYFQLYNRAVLANAFLHPIQYMFDFCNVEFTPYVGAGIGYANNEVRNFYTVGSLTVAGEPIGSTTSIGNSSGKNSFAWQGTVAFNMRPENSHFSTNVGYRYFDGGHFSTPSIIFTNSDGIIAVTPWRGDVEANQLFVEFKYTV